MQIFQDIELHFMQDVVLIEIEFMQSFFKLHF